LRYCCGSLQDLSGDGSLDRFELDLWFVPLFNAKVLAELSQAAPAAGAAKAMQ
jgi:hypothetical protein